MTVPEELFRFLDAPTSHRFCLALYLCEPLCLELYTTEALRLAEREADRMLSVRAAERLRAEIARRDLLFPGGRGSDVWTERGQARLRALHESAEGVIRRAAEGLLLPPREGVTTTVIPILVSARELIETRFAPAARSCLRPGLCLLVRAEREREGAPGVLFEGVAPTDDMMRSARTALDLLDDGQRESLGRVVVRLPAVAAFLPIHGGSATLAFAEGFGRLAAGDRCPSGVALTGSVDPVSGRVAAVDGIDEKIAAARATAFHTVCYPSAGEISDDDGLRRVGIPDRDPRRFLREARRRATPWHERLAFALKAALFLGMCVGATPLVPLYETLRGAADGVGPWCDAAFAPGIPRDIAFAGAGIPIALILAFGPIVVFLQIFLLLARQVDCAIGWIRRHRWESDIVPAVQPEARIAKGVFVFLFIWGAWIVVVAATVPLLALPEILPPILPLRIGYVVGFCAFLYFLVAGIRSLYDRIRRRTPFLR